MEGDKIMKIMIKGVCVGILIAVLMAAIGLEAFSSRWWAADLSLLALYWMADGGPE